MITENEFYGKVAVVTGGTGGIGRALTLALAGRGCRVWFCGRNGDPEGVEAACGGLGRFVRCDLSRPGEPERFVAEVLDSEGKIDYLVNNVAFDGRLAFADADAEEFDRFVGVNLKAAFLVTRAALAGLRAGEGRAVVNLGTTNWMLGLAPFTLYGAAKSGLVGFTRALARELGPEKIRVNLLSPGWVMTAKQLECYVEEEDKQQLLRDQALPFLLEETHITGPALFLLSSAAAAVTGQNLVVDGGKLMQ